MEGRSSFQISFRIHGECVQPYWNGFPVGVQDSLVIKPQKKYPLGLWMAVLGLIMISGMYICSLCLKQRVLLVTPNQMKVKSTRQTCRDPSIPKSELRYMHYPEPISYSRYGVRLAVKSFQIRCIYSEHSIYIAGKNVLACRLGSLLFYRCRGLEVGGLKHC